MASVTSKKALLDKTNERLESEKRVQDQLSRQIDDLDKENAAILEKKQQRLAQLHAQARRQEDELGGKMQREKARRQNLQEILRTVQDIINSGRDGCHTSKEFDSLMAEGGVDVSKVPRKKLRESLASAGIDMNSYTSICKSPRAAKAAHDYAEISSAGTTSGQATYVDLDTILQKKAANKANKADKANKAKNTAHSNGADSSEDDEADIRPPAPEASSRLFTPVKRGNKKVLDHITNGFRNPGGEFVYKGGDKEVASPRVSAPLPLCCLTAQTTTMAPCLLLQRGVKPGLTVAA